MLSFIFIMVFVGSSALVTPIQQSIVSKLAKDNYGEIMGIQGSYKAIGMIVGSLASGFIFDIGNKLPFILSGICCLIVCILVSRISLKEKVISERDCLKIEVSLFYFNHKYKFTT